MLESRHISYRNGIPIFLVSALLSFDAVREAGDDPHPNFIIILTDDQGYHDLGCYGAENMKTPCIDRMAEEGIRFTSFYVQPVSGPSRGALMTGRYPCRIGGGWTVFEEEQMIPELLKPLGYVTACIGKWDMSGRKFIPGQLPNDQGFDYYFGTLGANDRGTVQLMRNKDSLYRTTEMSVLTAMYTDEAIGFIRRNRETPFFLYLAHTMPHVQIDASKDFRGRSGNELYGDVIEEIDWNTGRLLDEIESLGLDEKTWVIYLSDNGPWSQREDQYRKTHHGQLATGSAFPLRGNKGSAWEGGFRVPCIIRAPEKAYAGRVCDEIIASIDLLPTVAALAGAKLPAAGDLDGMDQSDLITGRSENGRRNMFLYHQRNYISAIRKGKWKLMLPQGERRPAPLLFNLEKDITESTDLSESYPEVVNSLLDLARSGPGELLQKTE